MRALLQLVTLFGLFAAGGFIGLGLASWAAPASGIAAAISVLLLPGAFAGGLLIWAGLDLLVEILGLLRRRRRGAPPDLARRTRTGFVPLSLALTLVGGTIAGALPGGRGIVESALVYGAVGLVYGLILARLAAMGYLPQPE